MELKNFQASGGYGGYEKILAFFIGSMLKSLQSRIISHAVAQAMHS